MTDGQPPQAPVGPELRPKATSGSLIAAGLSALRSLSPWRWAAILSLAIGLVAFISLVDIPSLAVLRDYAVRLGPWFPFLFWCAYVIFTLFPMPRTLWTVSAGLLFGPWAGMTIALTALTVSALVTVVGIRCLFGGRMTNRIDHPAAQVINAHLERRGWVAIASLRMVAGVPFSILNYVAAMTSIPLSQFTIATMVGSIPTTMLGIFFGDALTGQAEPWVVVAMICLGALGVAILMWDAYRMSKSNYSKSSF